MEAEIELAKDESAYNVFFWEKYMYLTFIIKETSQ